MHLMERLKKTQTGRGRGLLVMMLFLHSIWCILIDTHKELENFRKSGRSYHIYLLYIYMNIELICPRLSTVILQPNI